MTTLKEQWALKDAEAKEHRKRAVSARTVLAHHQGEVQRWHGVLAGRVAAQVRAEHEAAELLALLALREDIKRDLMTMVYGGVGPATAAAIASLNKGTTCTGRCSPNCQR